MVAVDLGHGLTRNRDEICGRRANPQTALSILLGVAFVFAVLAVMPACAQPVLANRINTPIRSGQWQAIRGTVHPMVAHSHDLGNMSGSTMIHGMSLVFRRSKAQEADLKNLLQEQQTKGSPLYHQWLKPGQFAARYGVSSQDLAKVATWLRSQGFKVNEIPASRNRIDFSGTAAQVDAAFRTSMHRYMFHGQPQWANATSVSVPEAIAAMTLRVAHLNTFRPQPRISRIPVQTPSGRAASGPQPHMTLQGGNGQAIHVLTPADIATIYNVSGLYNSGITGAGQTIAVAGQTDIMQYQSDIMQFRKNSGLNSSNLPTQILVTNPNTGPATVYPSDLEEADLDVEWAGAIAKDATILYITVGSNLNYSVFTSMEYAIETPLIDSGSKFVPIISISYGNCEQVFSPAQIQGVEQFLEQAAAQGQTVVAASGDTGSADCDNGSTGSAAGYGLAVDFPSSSPYVTGVGGTSLSGDQNDPSQYWSSDNSSDNGSALQYIPESVWNNTPNQAGLSSTGALSAGGGGSSVYFDKPSWQSGLGDSHRDVPDISLAADPGHNGYVLCTRQTNASGNFTTNPPASTCQVSYFLSNGTGYLYGGTSVAAPQTAAMIALWNQEAGNTNGVGNANPILYLEAKNSPGVIHDVTSGSNAVVCQQGTPNCVANGSGGYAMSCCNAGPGYDLATGLGSVDATAMGTVWPSISQINPSFSLVPSPAAIDVTRGSSATAQLILSPAGGFSGTVNLSCSNPPVGITCSFTDSSGQNAVSVAVTPGQQKTVTLTVSADSSAAVTVIASRTGPTQPWPNGSMPVLFAGTFGLFLIGIGKKRRLFPPRWAAIWILALASITMISLTACSSGSPGSSGGGGSTNPPIHHEAVTVTGTSGASTASTELHLTVS